MTEEEFKEFEQISDNVDQQRKECHSKFMDYSQSQLKLDQLVNKQSELFRKSLAWINGSVK